MVVPSLSRILDLSTSIRSLSIWYDSRQAFSSQPTCGLIARTAICASECLRVCRRMSILSITTHILYVSFSMCAQKQTYTCLFSSGKGNAKERREASLSVSLSLSLAFILVVIVVEPNLSRLDSRTFENFFEYREKRKTILRYPSLKESRFLNFKSLLSFFFFQFIIYNAFARNATTYFKSFHICHRSTTHVHIRSMSYTQYIYFIHIHVFDNKFYFLFRRRTFGFHLWNFWLVKVFMPAL